ncbi:DUF1731 domain-containing protein [Agriterribacter sp.]|nr:DUF1731 domain-containing protein [Agriterribacter sp.]HRO46810.1 DUF1731 domain-containing protein [Agriterribacter sp.]HRQ15581.1 DUF1731 domain-containing protein [Agriterribacter sp.]
MRTFRKLMNISFGIPSPKLLLEAEYAFKYPTLDAALKDILNR